MTPAENPSAMVNTFGLNFFERRPIKLPTPVARPANRVSKNAYMMVESTVISPPVASSGKQFA